jgi:Flp pilus assembly protein TadG
MKLQKNNKDSQREKGQSLVELAVSLVILLLLVGGIVDLGRAFFTSMSLRDAVQEGALYGSIDPTNTTAIKNHVLSTSSMIPDMIGLNDITIEIINAPCTGNRIKVTAVYSDFPITMPFMGVVLGGQTIPLSASVTDTILKPGCY